VCLLWLLQGCVTERVLSAEQLMPPGSKEVMPPRDFVDDVLGKPSSGQFWMRGCTYDGGWEKLSAHIRQQAEAAGYHQIYYHSPKMDQAFQQLHCKSDDFILLYKSAGQTVAVGAINLKLVRDKGAQLEGLAQYVLMGGLDLPNQRESTSAD
jgi:hypothetical protein